MDSARSWRGGQNQVLLSARGMAALGHEVVVGCQKTGILEARCREAGLAVHSLRFHGDLSPGAVLALAQALHQTRPHVVHAHDPHALSAAALACRWIRGPVLVASRRVDFPVKGWLSHRKYLASRRIIAVSRAISRVLEVDGLPADRVRVVYEGVVDRPGADGGREALQEMGIPRDAFVVGNVAALTDHKDHRTLLAAAAHVLRLRPEVRFLIVGDGELRGDLEAQAAALGVTDRVIFTGFRSDLDRLLPALDVFCLSSHMEGLGTSLLDAMAFRRPIVATGAGGIPEAVEDGVTGRVVPVRNPTALAEALLEVLGDDARRAAMGRAGRRRFEERFTAERMVRETLAVYEEAL